MMHPSPTTAASVDITLQHLLPGRGTGSASTKPKTDFILSSAVDATFPRALPPARRMKRGTSRCWKWRNESDWCSGRYSRLITILFSPSSLRNAAHRKKSTQRHQRVCTGGRKMDREQRFCIGRAAASANRCPCTSAEQIE